MAETSAGDSSQSKSLLWMMLAFFGGLGILLGGGMLLASRVMKTAGVASAMNKNTVRTPVGSFRLEKEAAVGPGLPLYPHAALVVPGEEEAGEAVKDAKSGIDMASYHTADLRDSVDNWYGKHLGPEFQRHDGSEQPLPAVFKDMHLSDKDIAFVAERGQQVRVVTLSLDASGTKISLIRLDKPAPVAEPAATPTQNP